MKMKLMKTNFGTHPPEKWAEVTAEQITDCVQIAETYPQYDAALQDKNVTRDKLVVALTSHHAGVQTKEKVAIQANAAAHLTTDLNPLPHVDEAMAAVNAAVAGSMFADHYAKPDTQQYIKNVLASHFATAMDIERRHHASKAGA